MGNKSMHDEWYPETERLLIKYWDNQERIQRLKVREQVLSDQIETLNKDLCQLLERQENQIGMVTEALFKKYKKLIHIRTRIFNLEEFEASIKVIVDLLSEEEKKLVERRYVFGDSNYQIGYLLHCSEHRIRNMHDRIINTVAQRLGKKTGATPS
jgi:DNA-directed RNA polymerase specialized sigma subunit